jgi:HEPN domain-containing protein
LKTNIVDNFLIKASRDLGTAELIFKNKPEFTDTLTFHCQQTIEKSLKAYLTFHNTKIKSNHDLIYLIEKCSELDSEFSSFSKDLFADVNDIGMSVRYDDIENDPKIDEAFRYLEFTREIYEFVNKKLNRKS